MQFSFSEEEASLPKYLETQGKKIPLKALCPRERFAHIGVVLILETQALAIQEVVDIIEIPNAQENNIDFVVYHGRKVPVFETEC